MLLIRGDMHVRKAAGHISELKGGKSDGQIIAEESPVEVLIYLSSSTSGFWKIFCGIFIFNSVIYLTCNPFVIAEALYWYILL